MNNFKMTHMPKVYFGKGALNDAFDGELNTMGETVMVAYGGGSIKKNGIYDQVVSRLKEAGKQAMSLS
ncbi:iron-containing alcohol dehydrogenase [uncultured Thomasclavelia sp.]|uniref:iron-containing alcohol dehydrogenase n=1 Tax=uncultured Thomasclavelia sp. TaxID=3025759 RepID=UPI0025E871FE|nr:iron-containing alcohol dehydrogenase [uncultured Thomasclavelia sp.]